MANLKDFIWCGAKSGMPMDLYLNRWPQIGNGRLLDLSETHVSMQGRGEILGKKFQGSVEIFMDDASRPVGTCTVIANGFRYEGCRYQVVGGSLEINIPDRKLTLQAHDKSWTWIGISGLVGSVGLWPSGMNLAHEDHFGEPLRAGAEARDTADEVIGAGAGS